MEWLKKDYLPNIQKKWESQIYNPFIQFPLDNHRPKFYILDMIPHPTSEGLGINHCRNFASSDVIARYKRTQLYNVFFPMGWDSFGVTTEKRAVSQGSHPSGLASITASNYREQMTRLGLSYNWATEIFTSSPEYYRWTQWFFLLLHSRGLVYKKEDEVNWCSTCNKVLRYAERTGNFCNRCGKLIVIKKISQWFAKITAYADELYSGLDEVDWPDDVVIMQRQRIMELEDWSISRQRYWGAPVPIIYCNRDGVIPVSDLPVKLPPINQDIITGAPVISLADIHDYVNTSCPVCGGPAKRDTDVISSAVCSCWYYLRFIDPDNQERPFNYNKAKYWMPIDCLLGNADHTNAFLLYARFATKVLADAGFLPIREPFLRFCQQGIILGSNKKRMTKNNDNVKGIDIFIDQYGADVVRFGLLLLGKGSSSTSWNNLDDFMKASKRFFVNIIQWSSSIKMEKQSKVNAKYEIPMELIEGFTSVTRALENYNVYQYVIDLKSLFRTIKKYDEVISQKAGLKKHVQSQFYIVLSLVAPFLSEELWSQAGFHGLVQQQPWPISEVSVC